MSSDELSRVAFSLHPNRVVVAAVPEHLEPALLCLFPDDQVEVPERQPDLTLHTQGPRLQLFDRTGPMTDAVEGRGEALGQLELMLAEYLVSSDPERRVLHAGGANVDGRAILLSGHGGSGKSTVTAAMAMLGLPVFGDDVVLVEPETGVVSPVRRLLKIMEEPRAALGIPRQWTPLDELWPEAIYLHPSDLGSTWAEPAAVRLIAFPTWSGDASSDAELRHLSGGAVMQKLLFQLLLIERHGVAEVELVAQLLDDAITVDMTWGDGPLAAQALLKRASALDPER